MWFIGSKAPIPFFFYIFELIIVEIFAIIAIARAFAIMIAVLFVFFRAFEMKMIYFITIVTLDVSSKIRMSLIFSIAVLTIFVTVPD